MTFEILCASDCNGKEEMRGYYDKLKNHFDIDINNQDKYKTRYYIDITTIIDLLRLEKIINEYVIVCDDERKLLIYDDELD